MIVTHYHLDHWYGAKAFKDEKAKIVAHKNLKEFYESGEALQVLESQKQVFKGLLDNVKLVPPDVSVAQGETFTIRVGKDEFEIRAMGPCSYQ